MADLLDIAPAQPRETVDVLGLQLEVQGIPVIKIARLLRRFPEFQAALSGGGDAGTAEEMALKSAEMIPAIIAAGTGHFGDQDYEEAAERLPLDEQIKIFNKIMQLTMPEAAIPFVDGSGTALPNGSTSADSSPKLSMN